MSRIAIELPTLQNWTCHNCGGCCKQHAIFITDEERERIESQGWDSDQIGASQKDLVIEERSLTGKRTLRLAQEADGSCVFLDEKGLCRIHGKFGEPAKPLACRIYPYAFHPKGDTVAVSLRFSCPSVTENRGTPVRRQKKEIREIAELVVPEKATKFPAPAVIKRTKLHWDETLSIVNAIDQTLANDGASVGVKVLRALSWLDLIAQTNFQNIRGERIDELLEILTTAIEEELQELPELENPSSLAMKQFRLLAGQYARKDTFASADRSFKGRWKQLRAAFRLTSGSGLTPAFGNELGEVPFSTLEKSFGPLPEESEELLTRYFRVKVQGLHFCGPAFYNMSVVEGFQSLAIVLPTTLWIARWRASTNGRDQICHEDVREALQIVDHQHGYSEALGTWGARKRVSTLAQMGQIPKLIAWALK
ncbi:Flagellin N-methylase [Thalassoglobus neptunius]|uniref:Flagellin N-methylase n=1 Tax=Thalassoglobus neptunius TaxID=1938619 RepID=A0A5C5X8N2_9PLAN|nr:YkgJ family cysteine cluster protein [Thalassoglobus neptunius]TWT58721.1 Flagellin N-methylase [Thalassoglobus neptunius]